MLPRLQAEESLLMANRVAVGTASMKKEDLRTAIQRWVRDAQPATRVRRAVRATPEALRAMGIGYRVMPKASTP